MNYSTEKRKRQRSLSILKNAMALFALLIFLTSNNLQAQQQDGKKIKSRFQSMRLDKSIAENLRKLANYDHFIFQLNASDKSGMLGKRKVYTLVVYAADKNGNILDPNATTSEVEATPLTPVEGKERTSKKITDNNDKVKMSNYIMSDKKYQDLSSNTTTAYLQFDVAVETSSNSTSQGKPNFFTDYITYTVYPVAAGGAKIALTANNGGEIFLKPSPPAPPSGD